MFEHGCVDEGIISELASTFNPLQKGPKQLQITLRMT